MLRSRKARITTALLCALLVMGLMAAGLSMAAQNENGKTGPAALQQAGQLFLSKLAAALGIDQSKLDSAIQDAAKQTLDQMVKDGQITQKQADQMLQGMQDNPSLGMLPFKGMCLGKGGFAKRGIEDVAQILGMTVDDLRAQLQAGKKLTDIAQAKGITSAQLEQQLLEQAKVRITGAVEAGQITQQQADEMINRLSQKKGICLEGFGRFSPDRMGKGQGWHGTVQQDSSTAN